VNMIIGITGTIAGGKSTLAKKICRNPFIFRKYFPSLPFRRGKICELDSIGHAALNTPEVRKKIQKAFGTQVVLMKNNCVNRNFLRKKALVSEKTLARLESIVHPKMRAMLHAKIESDKRKKNLLYIVAALPKTFALHTICDDMLFVVTSKIIAWKRAKKRQPMLRKREFEVLWRRQEREKFF